ncbi:hypothetical protein VNO77_43192 [Canavalia gladiata]|uniref:Uncharacterized protein n=1 Tax=Canavalia gladiata TaxID=3824 RepID=A0AAN9JXA3_CANGL
MLPHFEETYMDPTNGFPDWHQIGCLNCALWRGSFPSLSLRAHPDLGVSALRPKHKGVHGIGALTKKSSLGGNMKNMDIEGMRVGSTWPCPWSL